MLIKHGNTSNIIRFTLKHSTSGIGLTGLTHASAGLIISIICNNGASPTTYTQAASNIETIATLGTYAAPTASKCRFKEVDSTNHKGLYEFQFANARFSVASARSLIISVTGATNLLDADYEIQLVSFDPHDSVRMGMTALPNAAADGAGGLPISDAGGLDLDTKLANAHEITAARMGALTDWIDGGRLDLLLDAVPTVGEIQTEMEENGASLLDTIRDYLENGTYGLSALETLIDEVETILKNATYGLSAIRDRGDAAWVTGGGGSISDILNVQPLVPNAIDLANTATVRIGLGLTNMLDDLPSTAEITPGTITIDRKAIGGTSWTNIVNAAACSELAGLIYYDEVFDSGTGYAAGDTIRITFKSQKIVVSANDYEITGTDGWVFQTYIREAMKGTDGANTTTPPTVAEIQTEMEENGASLLDTIRDIVSSGTYGNSALQVLIAALQTDLDNGTDGLGALKTLIDTVNTDLSNGTDGLGALKTLIDTVNTDLSNGTDGLGALKALIDAITTHLTDVKGTGFVKDTDSLPQCLTATGFSTHDAAAVKTAIEAAGSHLALIKAVTDALTVAAATKLALGAGTVVSGAAATGTLSTTQMTTNLTEATNDHYNGRIIIWTSGVLEDQATDITDYDGATKKLTYTATTEAPSDGDTFIIV